MLAATKLCLTACRATCHTISQQYRWHALMESVYQTLREKNTGKCRKSGKSFGEVMHHFVVGGDETCVMANHAGDVKIIGSADVKKQEKNVDDSRCSMTMYRTGTASGNQGPTMFILAGEKRRKGYGPAFLEKYGAAPGSDVYMNESAYMTMETWEEMSEPLMEGYRKMPFIKENPQWHFVEITDGFGAHHNSYKALKTRSDHKCNSVKEEGDTSQCNQAYDALVGLEDKRSNVDSLAMMRRRRYRGDGVIDQWGLVHVGLHAIRGTKSESWEASFIRVNLHPHHRLPFVQWCDKLSMALLAGQTFKEETAVNTYNLLPSCWQGMEPEEKKKVTKIIDDCGSFTVEAVRRLQTEANVLISDMQSIRLGYEVAKQYPEQLDMVSPSDEDIERVEASDELSAKAQMRSATHGLASFELKPEGMSNKDLFPHMVNVRKRTANAPSKPSEYLNVEMTAEQQSILQPSEFDLSASRVLENAGGRGARMKVAERRLNATGEVQNFSSLTNSDERLRRLENANILECSLAEISRLDQAEKNKKAEEEKEEYEMKLPRAIRKYLSAGRQIDGLTCKEIRAVALCVYSKKISKSKRKGEHVAMLKRTIASDPSKMSAAEARASSESTQGDGNKDGEEEEEEEEEGDDYDNGNIIVVGDDYGEEHYEKRVAKYHVEDRAEDGGPRLCFGTVVNSGFPDNGPRKNTMHWKVKFDENDAAVYGPNERGQDEDLDFDELMDAFELYKEHEGQDVKKPSASNQ